MEKIIVHKTESALKKCVWREVRDEVIKVNPDLAREIDLLDPCDDYALYTLEVPWGQHLLKDGRLCLPNAEGRFVSVNDLSIDNSIREDLNYNVSMPFGAVLKNSVEFYYNNLGRLIQVTYMPEGKLFALWLSLQNPYTSDHTGATSNIVAGTRFIHFLPNIYDADCFKKIQREFLLKADIPYDFLSQWKALVDISSQPSFPHKWTAKVVYFGRKWKDSIVSKASRNWRFFREFILSVAWEGTNSLRNTPIWDISFAEAIHNKNLKPNPYLYDIIKHLYCIGDKSRYGYIFANDDNAAPICGFQKIFDEIYGLRYAPLMMHSGYLGDNQMRPVYYSLEVPTLYSFSPKSRQTNTKIAELRDISRLVDKIKLFFTEDKLNLYQCPLYSLVQNLHFSYIHAGKRDDSPSINHTTDLISEDSNLQSQLNKYPHKSFPEHSPFFNGCIKLSFK